jgi:hypothetical protein
MMMKKLLCCIPLLFLFAIAVQAKDRGNPATHSNVNTTLPLLFAENKGQVTDKAGKPRPDILFTANNKSAQVFLTANGIQYQFTKIVYPEGYHASQTDAAKQAELAKQVKAEIHLFSLTLQGANPAPVIRREMKNAFTENFYTERVPKNGITQVATYGKVVYENVYPHIDWVLYSKDNQLKYDFVVHPGGDPSLIKLNIKDAEQVSITAAGELLMKTSLGEVKEKAPLSFANGKEVPSRFKQNSDGTIGFEVTSVPNTTLVIDPSVTWSTYYGGSGVENAQGLSLDASGNIYIAGITTSTTGIAMAGGYQTAIIAVQDNFIVKFSASGTPLWATYYGSSFAASPGGNVEQGGACTTDNAGNVYLWATGPVSPLTIDMSTPGAYQTAPGGGFDAYLVKFNASGVRQWATYFGGSSNEFAYGCTSTATGDVYITGITVSTSGIATAGAHQTVYGGGNTDFFLAKFNTSGALQWSTYLGGSNNDGSEPSNLFVYHNCALDNLGNILVAGKTESTAGIASAGAQQTVLNGTNDAFLAKFSPTGTRLWSTYFGGNDQDGVIGVSVAVDASNNIFLTGDTYSSTGVATAGAYMTAYAGSGDNFLAKFNASGNLQWATYQGWSGYESPGTVSVNTAGSVFLAASTYSFPSLAGLGGFQFVNTGGSEGYITKFNSSGGLQWASYFGGPATDVITACITSGQDLYILGNTQSISGIATPGAFKTTLTGTGTTADAFLAKISDVPACIPDSVTVALTKCSNQLPFIWNGINVASGGPSAATYITLNAVGCDSVVKLNLTVKAASAFTQVMTKCSNQMPFVWNGITVSTGGPAAAIYTTPNSVNCDSVTTLNLTVNNTSTYTDYDTICAGELPYTWNSIIVTAGGPAAATYTTPNAAGCDSVVTLNLTVSQAVLPTVTIAVSPGSTVPYGTPVTFTANITNGGTLPVLQWKKNGINVGISSATYTDFSIDSGDVVTCYLVSSAPCAFPDTAFSNAITISVIMPPPPCLVPVTLISTDIQFNTAVFKWAVVEGALGYEIVLDMLSGDPTSGLFTTDTSYHASALLPGTHYFHIRTRCANGDYSPWIEIKIIIQDESTTGISGPNGNSNKLSLYPNPNNGIFFVQGTVPENRANVDIVDKAGRTVYRSEASTPNGKLNHRINLADGLAQGIYLLRVVSGNEVYVVRFVHN